MPATKSKRRKKYRVLICDDSERERHRFYKRQFGNFQFPGVVQTGKNFVEKDPLDSVDKLYKRILELREKRCLPDLVLLDLFYKKKLADVDAREREFVSELLTFKQKFLKLKQKALEYLDPSGIGLLQRIREVDQISPTELPIAVYTDKNFNFLPSTHFNLLYKLDAGTLHKDRDEDPLAQISPASEY